MIKKSGLFFVFIFSLFSCQKENKELNPVGFQKEAAEIREKQINFDPDATPKYFSAKTIKGNLFNSKDYTGKNLMIFIYPLSFFTKSQTYDMTEELNNIYTKFKDKVHCIGIINGISNNEKELNEVIKNSKILFDQIDNTRNFNKPEKVLYNIHCYPAKILINEEGRVIHSSCGGGNSETLIHKLDSLISK